MPDVLPIRIQHARVSVETTAVQIAPARARHELIVQNAGTTIVYLKLMANGDADPTATAYDVALAACSAADAGDGGAFITDLWEGAVKAIGSADGGAVVVTEIMR